MHRTVRDPCLVTPSAKEQRDGGGAFPHSASAALRADDPVDRDPSALGTEWSVSVSRGPRLLLSTRPHRAQGRTMEMICRRHKSDWRDGSTFALSRLATVGNNSACPMYVLQFRHRRP